MKRSGLSRRELTSMLKAAEAVHQGDADYKRALNFEFIMFFIAVLAVALAIRLFIFAPVRVSGPSMLPTLHDGERMIVTKTDYWFTPPERGDVIICYYPDEGQTCVKRVVGLGGETIEVFDGKVLINGAELDESAYWEGYVRGTIWPIAIPEGAVYVMGDNRNESKDSRDLSVGAIPYERIVGKVRSVVLPFDAARKVS